jgi:hypothetical protein
VRGFANVSVEAILNKVLRAKDIWKNLVRGGKERGGPWNHGPVE